MVNICAEHGNELSAEAPAYCCLARVVARKRFLVFRLWSARHRPLTLTGSTHFSTTPMLFAPKMMIILINIEILESAQIDAPRLAHFCDFIWYYSAAKARLFDLFQFTHREHHSQLPASSIASLSSMYTHNYLYCADKSKHNACVANAWALAARTYLCGCSSGHHVSSSKWCVMFRPHSQLNLVIYLFIYLLHWK